MNITVLGMRRSSAPEVNRERHRNITYLGHGDSPILRR